MSAESDGYAPSDDGTVRSMESESTDSSYDEMRWLANASQLPKGYAPLQKAVAHLLLNESLRGVRCSAEQLMTPLNALGGVDGREDVVLIDDKMLGAAFSKCGKEFAVSYAGMHIPEGGDNILYVRRKGKRDPRSDMTGPVTDFGIHSDDFSAAAACRSCDLPPSEGDPRPEHPLDNLAAVRRQMTIPPDVQEQLQQFLKDKQAEKKGRAIRDKRRKEKYEAKKKKKAGRKRSRSPNASAASDALPSEVTPAGATSPSATGAAELAEAAQKKARLAEEELGAMLKSYYQQLESAKALRAKILAAQKEMDASATSNNDSKANVINDSSDTLYYIANARCGKLQLDNSKGGVIHFDEIKEGLLDLPSDIDNLESEVTRLRTGYSEKVHGASMSWVPNTHELKIKNRQAEVTADHDLKKRLDKLFQGEISTWSYEAQRIMIACSLFGYGCSDEATIMIMAGTVKALFHQLGIEINDMQIAKAFPSRATLASMEVNGAADCLLGICQEIADDNAQKLGLTTDHGHRKDQDHFVKLISWAGLDEEGRWTVKFYCVDIDSSGHSAAEAALAVKISTDELLNILNFLIEDGEASMGFLTGDGGGGASAPRLQPELIKNGVLDQDSKMIVCDIHNLYKALEIACADTWGRQGIGHKTPFQMVWLFVSLLKKIRKTYGREGLDEMWAKVVLKLRSDPEWQKLALDKCKHAFGTFIDVVEKLEEGSDEDIDASVKLTTEAPKNLQDPVFSRWGTMLAAVKVFVENWVVVYFFAFSLKEDHDTKSHVFQLACALISLMNNKAKPTSDGESLDTFVRSFEHNQDGTENKLKPGETPIFEAVLYFLDGFNNAYFQDMYNYLLQDNPFLGKNTFGQLSQYGPERGYVMSWKLDELEEGRWKSKPEFAKFREVLQGVGQGEDGTKYFEKVTKVFFERFRYVFEKHMGSKWRSSKTVHYVLGGDKYHQREFARWLVDYKQRIDPTTALDPFAFTSQQVTLGSHHEMTHGPVTVNLAESMKYITSEADRDQILEDPFVKKHWHLISQLAESGPEPVDLFQKTADGKKLDKSSWNGVDYEPLFLAIWTEICPHSSHQQRCENYVQLTGLLSKTGVAEVRRTCRAIMIGSIIRRFNPWSLDKANKARSESEKISRLQGSDKTYYYLKYITQFFKLADRAKAKIGGHNSDRYKAIVKRLKSADKKASAVERQQKLQRWEKNLRKKPTEYTAELPAGIEKTARVAQAVYLRILTKTNRMEDAVDAEIRARKIDVTEEKLKSLSIAEKRKLLRVNELVRRIKEELKEADVKYIIPVSAEMTLVLTDGRQQEILDKEAGIISLEAQIAAEAETVEE